VAEIPLEMTGVAVDLPPFRYPPNVWTRAENVEMGDGFPRRARGFGEVFGTPIELPRVLQSARIGNIPTWVYGGDTKLGSYDGSTHTDITGTNIFDSTGILAPWTSGSMNENIVLNNLTGQPMYYAPGAGAALVLPGWDPEWKCEAMRVHREFIIAMNFDQAGVLDPDLVRWSDRAPPNDVPQSWTAETGSLAGSVSAAASAGALVDGITLRETFYIFKQHATFALSLIGGQFVFQQRPVFSTLGMLTRNCAVEWRGQLIILTDGDIVITNGVQAESLADRRIKSAIFNNIDGDNYKNAYVVLDKAEAEVWICVPSKGNTYPDFAAVWSIEDNQWGFRDLGDRTIPETWPCGSQGIVDTDAAPETWSSKTTTWNTDTTDWDFTGISPADESLLFGSDQVLLQAIDELSSYNGTPPQAYLERTGLDLGEPDKNKYIKRVWPKFEGTESSTIEIRVGASDLPDGNPDWGNWEPFVIGQDSYVPADSRGKYIALAMRSESNATWRTPGFNMVATLQGRF